jgi:hypothetical protein
MNYKIIIYILALTLVSAMIGGGAVYLATNSRGSSNSEKEETTKSSQSKKSSSVETSSTVETKASVSEAPKSKVAEVVTPPEEKPTGQKFTGWLGSTNIEMYLNFKQDKITGKYYNSYDKKWYNLDGYYENNGQNGNIRLVEYDNNILTGNISFVYPNPLKFANNAENQSVNNQFGNGYYMGWGIQAREYYTNTLKTLSGSYSDNKFNYYDLFISTEPKDIDYFQDISKEYKVLKLDSGSQGDITMLESDGKYYFTFEDWKIPKDTKIDDKLMVSGKIRSFSSQQGIEIKPWISEQQQGEYQQTNQGIFQISSVKKI